MNKKPGIQIFFVSIILFFSIILSGCINNDNNSDDDLKNIIQIKGKDGQYSSIKDAINDCEENDVILVGKGVYKEKVVVYKSVTLLGEDNDKTIIDADELDYGMYIIADFVNVENFTIKNSGGIGYTDAGIYIQSKNNIISNNKIVDNKKHGIYVFNGSNNSFIGNFFSGNTYGIYAVGLYENQINNLNIVDNIYLNNSELGIYLRNCENSIIKNNVISDSNYGMHMQHSDENFLSFNLFTENNIGLYLCCGAENNIIFKNDFLDNYEYNAMSNVNNTFDYLGFGNFWDDYNGYDNNSDGFGDQPYIILHNEYIIDIFNQDNYPLMDSIR